MWWGCMLCARSYSIRKLRSMWERALAEVSARSLFLLVYGFGPIKMLVMERLSCYASGCSPTDSARPSRLDAAENCGTLRQRRPLAVVGGAYEVLSSSPHHRRGGADAVA